MYRLGSGIDLGGYSQLWSAPTDRIQNSLLQRSGTTCPSGFPTITNSKQADRWIGVAVTDTITEILIFLLSIIVVFPLQMRVQRKITVALSFLPRLV